MSLYLSSVYAFLVWYSPVTKIKKIQYNAFGKIKDNVVKWTSKDNLLKQITHYKLEKGSLGFIKTLHKQ